MRKLYRPRRAPSKPSLRKRVIRLRKVCEEHEMRRRSAKARTLHHLYSGGAPISALTGSFPNAGPLLQEHVANTPALRAVRIARRNAQERNS